MVHMFTYAMQQHILEILKFFLKIKKATWFNVHWINPIGGILLEEISEKNKCVSKINV